MYKISKIGKEAQRIYLLTKIVNILLYIIIIPVIIFNFTLIAKSFINPNKTPDFFGYKNFIIVSGSMEPTIMTGDAIFVKEVPQNELEVNDIISFQDNGIITTHRIIEIIEENGTIKYKTKGDHNNTEDKEKVAYEKIEGKYQFKINGFGIVLEILQSKLTLVVLIGIIIFNYWYHEKLKKTRNQRSKKREQYNQEKNKDL